MKVNPAEISNLIKDRIAGANTSAEAGSVGTVVKIADGIATIHGLADAMYGEMIQFDENTFGMALNLERDTVGVVVLGRFGHIKEGDQVQCTGKILEVPVGDELMGRVVDGLGRAIDGKGAIETKTTSPVERIAPGVIDRKSVDEPLATGIKSVDSMIPIGRGQRELIIGDRQIGKTAIAIDTIINQKDTGVKCIYVAVGQKASSVKNTITKLEEAGAMSTRSLLLQMLLILLRFNSWRHTPVVRWVNTTVTAVKTH